MHYTCRDLLWRPMTFAGPNNYLQVPGFFRRSRLAVKFKFRSWDYTGLLMFTRFADDLGSMELGLSEGQVNITLTQPGNKRLRFAAGNLRLHHNHSLRHLHSPFNFNSLLGFWKDSGNLLRQIMLDDLSMHCIFYNGR